MAIHIFKADGTQPGELGLNFEQLVRRILGFNAFPYRGQEPSMEALRGGGYALEAAENTAWPEYPQYYLVKAALAFMRTVVDGEARNNSVQRNKLPQEAGHIAVAQE